MNEFKSLIKSINNKLFKNIASAMQISDLLAFSTDFKKSQICGNIDLIKCNLDYIHKLSSNALRKLKGLSGLSYGYCYYFSLLIFYIAVSLNLDSSFYIGVEKHIDFYEMNNKHIGHAWVVIDGEILDETNVLYWNVILTYKNEKVEL